MALSSQIDDLSARFALDTKALGNLKLQAKNDPQKALTGAAGQFEALFLQMMLKSMRDALPQDGPLSSETTKTYTAMFDQQIAQQLSRKGIGLAALLKTQLARTLPPAQVVTATPPASQSLPAPAALHKVQGLPAPPAPLPAAPAPLAAPARPAASAATDSNSPTGSVATVVQAFIDKVRPYAEAVAQQLGIPAHYLIAQAGLETGWGRYQPHAADGTASRNLFGIKATSIWKGASVPSATTEFAGGQTEKTTALFRAYGSYADSFQDFATLLQKSRRYANALANTHDPGKYAASLQQAGYATDPHYADKLARAIQTVARYAPVPPVAIQVVANRADTNPQTA